jgi:NAD(P)-dependent dehydrogenase (short-subunit alcohol dehydrogenase family)
MLLKNKIAVVYGAGGSIGGAVARAFAQEGAYVYLTGHHRSSLQKVFDAIKTSGGTAEMAEINALDEDAIKKFLDTVIKNKRSLDISFCAIGLQDMHGVALVEMSLDDFMRPIDIAMRSQFLTATAAGRVMMKQRSGVILSITATPGGMTYPLVGGFGATCVAIEAFSKQLACELGPHGVRVVTMRSAGSPDSSVFIEAIEKEDKHKESFVKKIENDTMLKRLPHTNDIANLAVFLASDKASSITGTTADISCGTTNALNYQFLKIPFHNSFVEA